MLRFDSVSRSFGGLRVLEDVNFTVPAAGIFGLIGPNGAGKTTLFNLATGLLRPSGGTILRRPRPRRAVAPHAITRGLGIARTFQNIRLFRGMNVLDNVVAGMHAHCATDRWRRCSACLVPFRRDRRARTGARAARLGAARPQGALTWPTTSRTANSASWSWRARWPRSPRCCCSTSRWPA
jgi:branched-chain amino acid transport system ATP-binding protein